MTVFSTFVGFDERQAFKEKHPHADIHRQSKHKKVRWAAVPIQFAKDYILLRDP